MVDDAPATSRKTRTFASQVRSWAASLLVHAVLLIIASLLTWTITREPQVDRVFSIDPGQPGGSSGAGSETGDGRADSTNGRSPVTESRLPPMPAPSQDTLESLAEQTPSLDANTPAASSSSSLSQLADAFAELDEASQGAAGTGRGGGRGDAFGDRIGELGARGVDIVLVLDATASMSPVIEQSKRRFVNVVTLLTELIGEGNVRFGVVAYKDYGDAFGSLGFPVEHLPITEDTEAVRTFLDGINASGGGSPPEPIHLALRVATDRASMGWGRGRTHIIILAGDSSVHDDGRSTAIELAERFEGRRGVINVIDPLEGGQRNAVQPDLRAIASAGGGSVFLLRDADRFWRDLILSVFGERFRFDVDAIIEQHLREVE